MRETLTYNAFGAFGCIAVIEAERMAQRGYTVHMALVLIWAGFILAGCGYRMSRRRDRGAGHTMCVAMVLEVCAAMICASGTMHMQTR